MRLRRLCSFERSYRRLTEGDKKRANKALFLLAENPRHPSLQVKKIRGTQVDIFEARVSDAIRMTFQIEGDLLILRVIGRHDEVLKHP